MKYCKKQGLFNFISMERDKINVAFSVIADTKLECVALAKVNEYNIDSSRMHNDSLIEMLCTLEEGIIMVAEVIKGIKKSYPTVHATGAEEIIKIIRRKRYVQN